MRRWVLVLGMHRSGTSAVAGALAQNGIAFGDSFIELQGNVNEKGFWEHAELVAINEALLQELDAAWFDPFTLPAKFADDWHPSADLFRRMCTFLRHPEFADASLCGLKDPRLSVLLPCWLRAFNEVGDEACYVLMNRDMDQVARSLQKRDNMNPFLGCLLWGEYTFSAEAYTRTKQRCWLDYEAMLANPSLALTHVQERLLLPNVHAVGFIDPTMQRQQRRNIKNPRIESLDKLAAQIAFYEENILEQNWSSWHAVYRDELAGAMLWLKALVADFRTLNSVIVSSLTLGEAHSKALATIGQRDEQIISLHQQLSILGQQHTLALETLKTRDSDLQKIHIRLKEEGEAHGYAIRIVEQRDLQVAQLNDDLGRLSCHLEELGSSLKEANSCLDAISARPLLRWYINSFVTKLWVDTCLK